MRVYFSRIALALTGLWIAASVPTIAIATEPATESPQVVIAEPSAPANLLNYTEYYASADTPAPAQKEKAKEAAPSTEANCCGCGTCESACGCDPHWIVGVESVWLAPQMHGPLAGYAVERLSGATWLPVNAVGGPIVSGLRVSPRISLGYQGETWGIQTRYWRMDETSGQLSPTDATGFSSVTAGHLKTETVDVEVTRLFCWRDTQNQLSFGVRYAEFDEGTSASAVDVIRNDEILIGNATARQQLSGVGLTMALTGYKPIQCSNLKLFYSARGSFIWDDAARNSISLTSYNLGEDLSIGNPAYGEVLSSGEMFIGEVQVGAQWNFELVKNCADAFFRFALEYQYWDTNRTGVASGSLVANANGFRGSSAARASDTTLDLIGFTIATGFTW